MTSCTVREFANVLDKRVKNEDKSEGGNRWPLVIDSTGAAGTFLRHRDTNYLQAQNPEDMKELRIRIGVLGALRYGKLCVVDLGDTDMFHIVVDSFNKVHPNLIEWILSKQITDEDKFQHLIKEEDGADYSRNNFSPMFLKNFGFVFVTQPQSLPEELIARTNKLTVG